jgi:Flp pilus assembly pilin Flp
MTGRRNENLMNESYEKFWAFFRAEEAAAATEYALLVSFIAVAIVAGLTIFGQSLLNLYKSMNNKVSNLTTP